MTTIYDDLSRQQPATTARQPTVLAHAAAILTDLDANLLLARLYDAGLGKGLLPHHVQTVVDFVTGLERRELPEPAITIHSTLSAVAHEPGPCPAAQDEMAAEPVTQ